MFFAMHENDDRRADLFDKLPVFLSVDVCCKAVLVYLTSPGYLYGFVRFSHSSPYFACGRCTTPRHHRVYKLRLTHNHLRHRTLNTISRNYHYIFRLRRPSFKQLPARPILHHTRRRQHNAGSYIIKALEAAQATHKAEVPGSCVADFAAGLCFRHALLEEALDVVIHCGDVRLVHDHAFSRQTTCVVDWYFLVFGMLGPVFVEDEEDLLRAPERKYREEGTPAFIESGGDGFH